jgi:hypothetical protein
VAGGAPGGGNRAGWRCARCGLQSTQLDAHHRFGYGRLGRERPEDLKMYCRPCHDLVHGRRPVRAKVLRHGDGMPRWFWVALVALLLSLAIVAIASPSRADGASQAYTLEHPGRADWLTLATVDGRYEIQPAEGCEHITAGMNVIADMGVDETWLLAAPGDETICVVALWAWVGDTPCYVGLDGRCDVAEEF